MPVSVPGPGDRAVNKTDKPPPPGANVLGGNQTINCTSKRPHRGVSAAEGNDRERGVRGTCDFKQGDQGELTKKMRPPSGFLVEEHFRQREQQVQRPQRGSTSDEVFKTAGAYVVRVQSVGVRGRR